MPRTPRGMLAAVLILSSLGLFLPPDAAHATPSLPSAAGDSALTAKVTRVLKDSRVTKATVGAVIADTASGTELFRTSATTALKPASNMKLLTAAAALDLLGPNKRFSTRVFAPARPDAAGTLSRLYLRGNGDPTLRESDLRSLAQQVKASGVRRVTGPVVGDGGFFDDDKYNDHWGTGDYNASYAAQIAGLTFAPSPSLQVATIQITSRPGTRVGKKAVLGVAPALAGGYVKLVNKTTTGKAGSGSTISVRRTNLTNTITVSGRIAVNRAATTSVATVRDPARYATHVFTQALRSVGVQVNGAATTGALPKTKVRLASDTSVPLSTIVRMLMKPSNNGMTEHLIKTLGRSGGKAGTWTAGSARVLNWLKTTQSVPSSVRIVDGSGLARANRLTARVIVRVLQYARSRPWFGTFRDALPLAGNPDPAIGGTLANRMVGTLAQNNLRAKTGTLTGVTALSGYVTDRNGRTYTFSMLGSYQANSPRIVFDKVGAALAGLPR